MTAGEGLIKTVYFIKDLFLQTKLQIIIVFSIISFLIIIFSLQNYYLKVASSLKQEVF